MTLDVTFITGNQSKADYLSKYLGYKLKHKKIELEEIQSLDLKKVAEHKVKQAYDTLKSPVLVEDVSLEFKSIGRLPGTFIKFYIEEVSFETLCRTLDNLSREATARCVFAYYDGVSIKFFESHLDGLIAEQPEGDRGFGWDKIFIPKGYTKTRASLSEEEDKITYLKIKPFDKLKYFFDTTAYNN